MFTEARLRRHRRERGEALVEFALCLPLLLVLTFMVMDFARAYYVKSMVTNAARQAARSAAVVASGGTSIQDAAATAAHAVLDPVNIPLNSGSPTVSGPTADPLNPTITCSVSSDFNFIFPGLMRMLGVSSFNSTMTLTATCTMRYERSS